MCSIPEPTVEGVVRGIPRYVSIEEFLRCIDWVSGSGGQTRTKVKGASGLTFTHGIPSEAIRVTFVAQNLPQENQYAGIQRQAIRGPGAELF